MQIACPNCATSYEIAPSALGVDGRMVRCAHCKEVWFATAPQPALAEAETPPRWEDTGSAGGWTRDQNSAPVVPEDRFAAQPSEVEFAVPGAMPQLDEAPSIAPQDYGSGMDDGATGLDASDAPAVDPNEEPDYYEVRRRRQQRQVTKRKSPLLTRPRLVVAMAIVLALLVLGREQVARVMPQTASLYAGIGLPVNLRGLTIESVKGSIEQQDGVPVLVIEGVIRNVTRGPIEVPRLRFATRNAEGAEIYSWTAVPERGVLPPGEMQIFRTRLASPPADSRQAYVRFLQRRDLVATSNR